MYIYVCMYELLGSFAHFFLKVLCLKFPNLSPHRPSDEAPTKAFAVTQAYPRLTKLMTGCTS